MAKSSKRTYRGFDGEEYELGDEKPCPACGLSSLPDDTTLTLGVDDDGLFVWTGCRVHGSLETNQRARLAQNTGGSGRSELGDFSA